MRRLRRSDAFDDLFDQMENLVQNIQGRDLDDVMVDFPVDVSRSGDAVTVEADLPGFERSEIDVAADSESLRIQAEANQEVREENEKYVRQERTRRSVQRTVPFPGPVDTSTVKAEYEEGVLAVTAELEEKDDRVDVQIG